MRVLFIGDVVAAPGVRAVRTHLPEIRSLYSFVIANGENSANNTRGLSRPAYWALRDAGVDLVTLGNHAWDHKDVYELLEREPVIRAQNYPPETPGQGHWRLQSGHDELEVIQLMGRVFMAPLENPFWAWREFWHPELAPVLLEVHAEATSEKLALAHFVDGEAAAVLGTHTHVPTLDYGLLPRGTAYQSDVGMTGVYDSIIGTDIEASVKHFLTARPHPFRAAVGLARFQATEIWLEAGRVQKIVPYTWEEV